MLTVGVMEYAIQLYLCLNELLVYFLKQALLCDSYLLALSDDDGAAAAAADEGKVVSHYASHFDQDASSLP